MSWTDPPPDPTNPDLLDNLRQFLINEGIVRDPRDPAHPDLPPLWLSPRQGIPSPKQEQGLNPVERTNSLVIAARDATDIPPKRYEGFLRNAHVEIQYKGVNPMLPKRVENQIRAAINDKRGWTMVQVPVNESLLIRGLQFLGSDDTGFLFSQEYQFVLWGPFTPVGP